MLTQEYITQIPSSINYHVPQLSFPHIIVAVTAIRPMSNIQILSPVKQG
jgi:hypothetical protein